MDLILVSIGGAIGASLRYLIGVIIDTSFPWNTLFVNAIGSLILGLAVLGLEHTELTLLISAGFCGSFTTYSTFSYETVSMIENDQYAIAFANALGNLVICLAMFALPFFIL